MEKVMVRLPHGYFNGGVTKLPTVSPTIDAHIDCWHILIGEQNGSLLYNNRNERRVDEKTAKRHRKNPFNERKLQGGGY